MKIAIVDTQTGGHHLEYIYGLSTNLTDCDFEVPIDLFCDQKIYDYISINSLEELSKNYHFRIKTGKLTKPEGTWLNKTKTAYNNIQKLSNYDRILFLYANIYMPALLIFALFQKPKFQPVGIYFNPYMREDTSVKSWIKSATLKMLLQLYPSLRLFILNDEYMVLKLNKKLGTEAFQLLRDPIPEFYYENVSQTYDHKGTYTKFTMLGSISERKGILPFLDAISKTKGNNTFIMAGKIEKSIIDVVLEKVNNLIHAGYDIQLHDCFLTNREFAKYISEADILVMPYLTKGASSGILGHAAYKNKFVIGPEKGFIGNLIKKYNLGYTIDPKDIDTFAKVIQAFSDGKRPTEKYRGAQYAAENSLKHFSQRIISELY